MLRTIFRVSGVGIVLGTALAVSAGTLGGLWDRGTTEQRSGSRVPSSAVAAASLPDIATPPSSAAVSASVAGQAWLSEQIDRRLSGLVTLVQDTMQRAVAQLAAQEEKAAARQETAKARARARRASRMGSSKPSDKRQMVLVKTITGGLSPKSIVADQNGRVFAMNMMYNHTITVFNRRYERVKDISDSIFLSRHGYERYRGKVQGAPVEAAVSPDGRKIYVANYSMYGGGFKNPGFDLCVPSDRIDRSFVYEIGTRSLRKTAAIQVGEVPKYLAITPNGRTMLVGNWCSWDISVVDLRKGREIKRIEAGVAPRGIVFSPDGRTAYVTLVGEDRILVIDMKTYRVRRDIVGVGERPRHLVMGRSGRFLYITSQGKDKPRKVDGQVIKYDTRKRRIVARSEPLVEPRTTVLSDDGRSLYVVDYHPGTVVKLATRDLRELQSRHLGHHPIGVTYDDASDKIWVSGYGGAVWVLKDR